MARSAETSKATGLALALCLASCLSACSSVPSSGPSRQEVIDSSARADPSFALVEVSEPVLDNLDRWPRPSFYGIFGDNRPAIEQTIGVGDSVQVTVWEASEGGLFSASATDPHQTGARSAVIPEQVVARDGSITMPYAGRIRVAGRTPPEVEKIIVDRLTGKAIQPQALVTVTHNVSSTVTVTGEVINGARVPLTTRGDRILDVLSTAGGIKMPVYETFIELTRGGRTVRVPMQVLISDPRENIYMRPGDVLTVVADPMTISAVGATGQNALVPFQSLTMNLDEAVARSGGLMDVRADPEGVFVMRYEPADLARQYPTVPPALLQQAWVPVAYHINMRDPAGLFMARRFAMHDKDILFVSNAPLADLQKLFSVLTSPAYSGASLGVTGAEVIH